MRLRLSTRRSSKGLFLYCSRFAPKKARSWTCKMCSEDFHSTPYADFHLE
uniref:Uncharacterized protein n=1 Tax=Rhizophora mucronata TaxID=61149 RepID=A0A2P2PPD3_RHIMU